MFQGRKIVTMLFSLLLAVLLWLYVVTAVAPEATSRVSSIPINIDGTIVLEERGLIITSQDVNALSLEVSTSRVNLSKLNPDTIRVSADASKIREAGEYALTCTVTFPDTVRSSDVDILRKSVDTVTITVTSLQHKSVPVQLDWTGSVKEGFLFEAESAVLEPAEITLYGPDYEVDAVDHAVVSYDVSDLEQTSIETVDVAFVDKDGEAVELSELTTASASQVSLSLPISRTREITLALDLVEGGGVTAENAEIQLDPETIRVKGTAEVIDALEDTFVVGRVDLSAITDREEKTFPLALPAGVTNISGETEVSAVVTLKGVSSDTISVSDIRVINAPEDYRAELTTRTAQVKVRGSTSEIRELQQNKENGIYILVDLADNTQTGAFTVAGRVVNTTHPAISVVDTVEIGVFLEKVPEPEAD